MSLKTLIRSDGDKASKVNGTHRLEKIKILGPRIEVYQENVMICLQGNKNGIPCL